MRAVKAGMAISTLKYRGVSHSTTDLDTKHLHPIHITPNPKWPLHRSRMLRRYDGDLEREIVFIVVDLSLGERAAGQGVRCCSVGSIAGATYFRHPCTRYTRDTSDVFLSGGRCLSRLACST